MEFKSLNIPKTNSKSKRIVIIGGGFAGVNLAKNLVNRPEFQVVMLDRHNFHLFQPLLYQVATSGLEPDSIAEPIRKIFQKSKNFYFRNAKIESIDTENKIVYSHNGMLEYDYLVLANGAKTNYFGNVQNFPKALPLKQLHHALAVRNHILQVIEEAVETESIIARQACLTFVIVGGGATGVEVSGAIDELKKYVIPKDYPEIDASKIQIILVEGGKRLLAGMDEKSSERSLKYLKKLGVEVLLNSSIVSYDGETVCLANDRRIPAKTLIWGAGVTGNLIDGLPKESIERGRYLVNEYSQINNIDNVYAIGDIAMMKLSDYPNGHPMVAPVAIQSGKNLAQNLINISHSKPQQSFVYKNNGSMATIGRNLAVVDLPNQWKIGGRVAWMMWMFVHLISIVGFRNKIAVTLNWFWSYLTFDRVNRIIIKNYERKPKNLPKEEKDFLESEEDDMATY
jgi:NADH:ubiquinone reductase (H+-translocating)